MAGKKVSWKVQTKSDETLSKGKATTDAGVTITVNFDTNKLTDLSSSDLIPKLIANPKEVVNQFLNKSTAVPMDAFSSFRKVVILLKG